MIKTRFEIGLENLRKIDGSSGEAVIQTRSRKYHS